MGQVQYVATQHDNLQIVSIYLSNDQENKSERRRIESQLEIFEIKYNVHNNIL